jgi:signal peptidase I
LIKRIIWMPWEDLIIEWWKVYIKEKNSEKIYELKEKYLNENNAWKTYVDWTNTKKVFKIPEKSYFVMWDNRNHSTDSRECFRSCKINDKHFVTKDEIVWKVFIDLGYFNTDNYSFTQVDTQKNTSPKFFNFAKDFNYE